MRECEPVQSRKDREKTKWYGCKQDDCGKIFSDQATLKKHMLTHGERMVMSILIKASFEYRKQ